jgi:hypothetical protein
MIGSPAIRVICSTHPAKRLRVPRGVCQCRGRGRRCSCCEVQRAKTITYWKAEAASGGLASTTDSERRFQEDFGKALHRLGLSTSPAVHIHGPAFRHLEPRERKGLGIRIIFDSFDKQESP